MFETKITKMLDIKYPIIGGAMMRISNAEFVASISEAGGLGILASANYSSRQDFSAALERIQELTAKPFAINLNLFPAIRPIDNNAYLDIMIEKRIKIVETSGHHAPEELCNRFKEAGMIWIHKCVAVRYALKVQKLGADIVTVVGYENGGATGNFDIGTLALVPSAVDAVKVPVIGGGGISDGRGLMAVLAMGAQGVIMGTRLLVTQECPIHQNLKKALLDATEMDTMLIMRSINATHRVWNNAAAQECLKLEKKEAGLEEILKVVTGENTQLMYDKGELDAGIVSIGQGIGTVHDIPTIKELFDRIISQAAKIASDLSRR